MKTVYLDNSATTKPSPAAVAAVNKGLTEVYENPSSRHSAGIKAAGELAQARNLVSSALGVPRDDLYFTASGTISDNIAILGGANLHRGKHVVTTSIEHPAVLSTFRALESRGFDVTYINPDKHGNITIDEISKALTEKTGLVSIMHVNNETGAIMPIDKVRGEMDKICPNALFHTDAVQSFGKLELLPLKWGIDLVSVSSHKIHGPKGAGALYVRKDVFLKPIFFGGGQEMDLHCGTENMPAIMGFGAACEEISLDNTHILKLYTLLKKGILDINGSKINSPEGGSPYILNVSFGKIPSEVILNALSGEGIYVSSGSACSSAKASESHVLKAMGVENPKSAIRFSLSNMNTEDDILYTLEKLKKIIPMLSMVVN